MNEHHNDFKVHPATAEQLSVNPFPVNPFQIIFLAHRKAHYTALAEKPMSQAHKRFLKVELRGINKQLDRQNLHRK